MDSGLVPDNTAPPKPRPAPRTLKAQIVEKDVIIGQLETQVADLEHEVLRLQNAHQEASRLSQTLTERNRNLSLTNISLNSLKRKAETSLTDELINDTNG
jgi:hypothetical protein